MTLPIEKYKDGYANFRRNPFTDADLAVDKTEDNLEIPAGAPYVIQLLELPRKNTPTSITVYCYDDLASFVESAYPPAQGEFTVDYPDPDGEGTGLVLFDSLDAGKVVRIAYKATGSPILEEFLNSKLSWPTNDPLERQIVAIVADTPVWRNNPIRMFHGENVAYHASGEDYSCMLFRFKKTAAEEAILLELKGAKLHQAFYTELKQHSHGDGSLAGTQPTHQHGVGTLAGTQPLHSHQDTQPGTGWTGQAGNNPVTITGAMAAGGGDAVAISGDTANAGGSPKTYPKALKVYIDGVDKTADILALCGFAALGDGTSGHDFVVTGTGEMDIAALVVGNGMHEIKVTEPIANEGGRVLLHLEMY